MERSKEKEIQSEMVRPFELRKDQTPYPVTLL